MHYRSLTPSWTYSELPRGLMRWIITRLGFIIEGPDNLNNTNLKMSRIGILSKSVRSNKYLLTVSYLVQELTSRLLFYETRMGRQLKWRCRLLRWKSNKGSEEYLSRKEISFLQWIRRIILSFGWMEASMRPLVWGIYKLLTSYSTK